MLCYTDFELRENSGQTGSAKWSERAEQKYL